MRQCGDCTMCCKVMAVQELNKPAGTWCSLVQIGRGCGDYENRPPGCRNFTCLWLEGTLPEDTRPDRLKAVLSVIDEDKEKGRPMRVVAYTDPATPYSYREGKLREVLGKICNVYEVIVVCGDKRTLLKK